MNGRRRRRGAGRRAGRIAGLVAAAGVALVVALPAAGAGASRTGAAPVVELIGQPARVHPGDPFDVQVRVSGAPAGAVVDMAVHERLVTRQEFRETLAGDLGDVEYEVPARPLTPGAAATTVGFTPGTDGTGLSGQGVYPVEVRLRSAAGDVIGRLTTYLTFLKDETPEFTPLQVAVIVDIGAPPSLRPGGETLLPQGAFERARERAQVLSRTPGVPLTLAPLPETLEALADSGPEGVTVVDEMRAATAGRRVLARTFVNVDLAALQGAGLIGEANYQAGGGADVVRNRLGVEPVGRIWLSGPTIGAEGARLAADLGFRAAVVPASAVALGDDEEGDEVDEPVVPLAPVRLTDNGPATMVSDPGLAAHLTSGDGVVAAHRFIAELAIAWLELPSIPRAVVVHLPADAPLDTDVVTTALTALSDGQSVDVVPVERIFTEVPPLDESPTTIAAADHSIDDRLASVAGPVATARAQAPGVGSVLDDPDVGASLQHSLLLSTGTDTPDDLRLAYVERVEGAAGSLADVVTLPDEYRITLTSRSSTIPITLTNLSEDELSVRVELEGDELEFPDGTVYTEVLPPGTLQIDVPVRTRTSGAFTLDVTVTSPDGSIVLDTSTFDVRSTAISGVGIVLSIGAGLFLAVWWVRHWHGSRRSRDLVPPPGRDDRIDTGATLPTAPAGVAAEAPYRPAHMARPRTRSG